MPGRHARTLGRLETGAVLGKQPDLAAQKSRIQKPGDSLRMMIHERIEADFAPAFAVKRRNFVERKNVALTRLAAVKVEDGRNFPGSFIGQGSRAAAQLVGRIGREGNRLGCQDAGSLVVSMTGMNAAPVVNNKIGAESAHHADHVFDNLVTPDLLGLFGSFRKPEITRPGEVQLDTIATRRCEKFLRADKTELRSLFRPESVLAAFGACQGKK